MKEKHVVATQNQQVRNEESKNEKWLTTVDMKILSVMGKKSGKRADLWCLTKFTLHLCNNKNRLRVVWFGFFESDVPAS